MKPTAKTLNDPYVSQTRVKILSGFFMPLNPKHLMHQLNYNKCQFSDFFDNVNQIYEFQFTQLEYSQLAELVFLSD